jgi:hypothetical protein
MQTVMTELDLTYRRRFSDLKIPEAYESLILDSFKGDHSNFVRDDELDASWKIFTPLLHYLDQNQEIEPMEYPYGKSGDNSAEPVFSNSKTDTTFLTHRFKRSRSPRRLHRILWLQVLRQFRVIFPAVFIYPGLKTSAVSISIVLTRSFSNYISLSTDTNGLNMTMRTAHHQTSCRARRFERKGIGMECG